MSKTEKVKATLSETTQEMGLTVKSSVTDVIDAINAKIKALKHIQDSVYKTPGNVQTSAGQKNIKDEKNITELVKAFASIKARATAMEDAYAELGMKEFPVVKVDGGTVEEWKDDIILRIQIIEQKETLDELNTYKKEWEELMDKEDRKELLLKKMKKFAGQE